jgi:NAD(P)H-hydrate epimerase
MKRYMQGEDGVQMSRDEVRSVDEWAIKTVGIPGVVLMENAGRSCAEFIQTKLGWHGHSALEKHSQDAYAAVCIFCGTGNNGGDGYVVARHLDNAGIRCRVIVCGNALKIKGDAKINLDIIMEMGIEIQQIDVDWRDIENTVKDFTRGASLIIDGLFGTGLQGQLGDNYIALINAINARAIPIIAIDIPSGLDCDSGRPLGAAIKARTTITFVAAKKGFAANPASAEYTGEVYVASIGIEPKK